MFSRITAALLLLAVGVASLLDAAANAALLLPPAIAARIGRAPGKPTAMLGEQLSELRRTDPRSIRTEIALARDALRETPLNPIALNNLGLALEKQGRKAKARVVMEQAVSMSRRDTTGMLWLFEEQARQGDNRAALRSLDLVLRTSPKVQDKLFPVITQALATDQFRDAFVVYLRRNPNWLTHYLFVSLDQPHGEENVARAIVQARGLPPGEDFQQIEERLLERLVLHKQFNLARSLFAVVPGHDPSLLTSVAFGGDEQSKRFGGLAWQFAASPVSSGTFVRRSGKTAMSVIVSGDSEAEIASKMLFLPEGAYRLSATWENSSSLPRPQIFLELACADGDAVLGRLELRSPKSTSVATVPSSCRAQMLHVRARADNAVGDSGATITQLNLVRNSAS